MENNIIGNFYFLYGGAGSGKDTLANILREEFDFLKIQLASTVKNYYFDIKKIPNKYWEQAKRINTELREDFLEFTNSEYNKSDSTMFRLKQILNKESLEFDVIGKSTEKNIVISDVRLIEEIQLINHLVYNPIGIFLDFKTEESKNISIENHKYNEKKDLFSNQDFLNYIKTNNKLKSILISSKSVNDIDYWKYFDYVFFLDLKNNFQHEFKKIIHENKEIIGI